MEVKLSELAQGDIIEFVHAVAPEKATRAMVDLLAPGCAWVVMPGAVRFRLPEESLLYLNRVGNINDI